MSEQIKQLYLDGNGARKVAKLTGFTRHYIIKILKELNVYDSNRKFPRTVYLKTNHTCIKCNVNKDISCFRKRIRGDRIKYETVCLICEYLIIKENAKRKAKQKRKDPHFFLKTSISYSIWKALKKNNSSKHTRSLKSLNYTLQELKFHLESLFESWMSWNNYGSYTKSTWDDNNPFTWTWNIDHIIPQSDLPYSSMEDDNFKTCWSLSNLRPYSSKQNLLDGINKIRHNLL